ncbi:MAG TPA: hypothetical protein VI728_02270 [Syntrophales bacterium]|nr:hypothetical protein [Syntrophales bacterium]
MPMLLLEAKLKPFAARSSPGENRSSHSIAQKTSGFLPLAPSPTKGCQVKLNYCMEDEYAMARKE